MIAREIPVDCLLGCTGQAIVGTGREVEATPALSLWVASLPQASILPMHLEYQQTPDGGTFVGWPDETPDQWSPGAVLLLLGDPFSFPADDLVSRLNEDQPGIPIVGGMASGAIAPGRNRLLLGQHVHRHGAVAAILQGRFRMDTVVSQGCRPVGDPFVITKADGNVILELAGVPALDQLQKVVADLSPAEQQCASQGLHLGRVVSEYQDERARGDYLIRNVLGIDRASGAIAVGDLVRPGQTVQFHIRDAPWPPTRNLGHLLGKARDRCADQPARGALLFTCNGRGSNLFDEPDHDAGLLSFCLGRIPTAGFFAARELGPIGSKNYLLWLHG